MPKQKNLEGKKLQIWWEEGFYPEEIDSLKKIITQWENKNETAIELTIIPQKDILADLENAIQSGNPPNIFYSGSGDLTVIPRLAWNSQLVDVSDVVLPLQDQYSLNALVGVNYRNRSKKKRSYYAVPLMQSAIHIHYWEDILINQVGEKRDTIPKDWKDFWDFWVQAQDKLQQNNQTDIYGLGMPMSLSLDTYNNFEQFLESYDAQILDSSGQLNINNPRTKQALSKALEAYTRFFLNGQVPPGAIDWDNTGNNVSLLSQSSLMTVNHTLSAPGSQRNDPETYYRRLSTIKWPNKPNGTSMRFVVELKQAVIFNHLDHVSQAKAFLAFLAQPENLAAYTKGAQGRYLPVMPALFDDPFWQDAKDSHISVAVEQLRNTRPAYQVFNPAYGEVAEQNVWGDVIRKIAVENLSIEQATEQAIAQIETIFSEWE
ncbi:ABC transporter substrate-binding protein [Acaryochloris sp. IP29b_bin.148]|uniref:ABC transporter substrate-binding protein n=1 Tax=Acaryochloris sp. IP29b_bin.148 TaxID=2969218 RepID=UPI00263402B9|nr:ABC transporter substrate-binding protein [Acaryochloris sp. IP29b_bin.148]